MLVSDATTPASMLPSVGAAATCMNSMPVTRPRMLSGVALSMIVARKIALMLSAAPAKASSTSASQSVSAKPKAAIATPHSDAATATTSPCRRTCGIHPEANDASERSRVRRGVEVADESSSRRTRRRDRREERHRHAEDHRVRVDEHEAEHAACGAT